MGSFLSDTFFKSFSSKYVYVEAATTTVAPSRVLSPVYTVLYMFSHCQFIKNFKMGRRGGDGGDHKVRTYKEYHSVCPSSELGLSQPLSRQRVFPSPPETGGREHTSLRVGGWGESQFRRGAYTVVLFICTYFVVATCDTTSRRTAEF